jgi:hypothetical protein
MKASPIFYHNLLAQKLEDCNSNSSSFRSIEMIKGGVEDKGREVCRMDEKGV